MEGRLETGEYCEYIRSNRVQNDGLLQLNLWIIDRLGREGSNDSFTFLVTLTDEQPAWRLRKDSQTSDDENAEDDLESNWETPSEIRGTVRGTEVDPVGDESTDSHCTALDTDEETTVGRARTFGLIGRDGGSVHSVSNSGDDSTDTELGQWNVATEGSDLDQDADDHHGGTKHN